MPDRFVSRAGDHSPSTSLSLLEQAVAGEPRAWERLVYLYSPLVDRWCRRRGLNEDEVLDLGQAVFLTVYVNLGRFSKRDAGDSFRKWLKTLTGRKITDYMREKVRVPGARGGGEDRELGAAYWPDPPGATPDDADGDEADVGLLLHRSLEMVRCEFEPRTYEAFWEVVVGGKAPAEVAATLGMKSVGAVYTARSRVARRLRELLDHLGGDWPGA